jgi:hypothetical protein
MAETPLGIIFLVGAAKVDESVTAKLLLALAAPVFADSMIFLKKPLFLGFGATRPPSMLPESFADVCQPA